MTYESPDNRPAISVAELAMLGSGEVAYVRPISSDDVKRLVPQAKDMPSGLDLFALLGADGTPITIADSREAVTADAWEKQLLTVSVH